jgi:hypothetical protein
MIGITIVAIDFINVVTGLHMLSYGDINDKPFTTTFVALNAVFNLIIIILMPVSRFYTKIHALLGHLFLVSVIAAMLQFSLFALFVLDPIHLNTSWRISLILSMFASIWISLKVFENYDKNAVKLKLMKGSDEITLNIPLNLHLNKNNEGEYLVRPISLIKRFLNFVESLTKNNTPEDDLLSNDILIMSYSGKLAT